MNKQMYKFILTTLLIVLTVVPSILVFANWKASGDGFLLRENDFDSSSMQQDKCNDNYNSFATKKTDGNSIGYNNSKNKVDKKTRSVDNHSKKGSNDTNTFDTKGKSADIYSKKDRNGAKTADKKAKSADNPETFRLPIVMYHSILNHAKSTYIVSESQFENDLIAFRSAGYTTVLPSEIINYVNGNGSLPQKPLLISFDDGHYNNMHYAMPLLEKHNSKAVISIVGEFSEFTTKSGDTNNPNYSHLTWSQIGELHKSGLFEIGNHTFAMHKYKPRFGISQNYNEPNDVYISKITADIEKLQTAILDSTKVRPTVFAYPFGKYNTLARTTLVSLGFQMMLTCNEGTNKIVKGDASSLHCLYRINRAGGYSVEKLMSKVNV